jgi:hypothetical protein
MTRQIIFLALAAVSVALFAMPAVASANWGVDPINQAFTGTSEAGVVGNLSAEGEPRVTCEGPNHMSGAWTNGTEGSFSLDITNCHVSVIFTIPCKTAGAPASNTILVSGTFGNVTIAADASGRKRGMTVTPTPTTIDCAGISAIKLAGSVIGRVTSDPPAAPSGCNVEDSEITLEFLMSGGKQDPLRTDSMRISESDDLTAQTGSEPPKTAGLEGKYILSFLTTRWTCNAP